METEAMNGEREIIELTEKEGQILSLLKLGQSNREIGAQLNYTEKTIRFYMTGIYRKFGIVRHGGKDRRLMADLMRGVPYAVR